MSEKSDFETLVNYIKYVVSLTMIWLGLITSVFVFFLWTDRQDMKSSIDNIKAEAVKNIKDADSLAQKEIQAIKDNVKYQTERQIAEVFRSSSIQGLIEERARIEINQTARVLIKQEAEREMKSVREEIKEVSDINYYAAKMSSFDAEGFLKLRDYAKHAEDAYIRTFAQQLMESICIDIMKKNSSDYDQPPGKPNEELVAKLKTDDMFVRSYGRYLPIKEEDNLLSFLNVVMMINSVYGTRFTICDYDEVTNFVEKEFGLKN